MNNYCNDCPHREQSDLIKKMFEKFTWVNFFHDCPISNPHVVGCLRKFIKIDWENYRKKLEEMGVIAKEDDAKR